MSCLSCIPVTTLNVTSTTITITWGAVTGAVGYQLEYKVNDPLVTIYTQLPQQTTTSVVASSLDPDTEYLFRVNTLCTAGESCYSATIKKKTLA
jgi:hypothetical protein